MVQTKTSSGARTGNGRIRRIVLGEPLDAKRLRLRKRSAQADKEFRRNQPALVKAIAWAAFVTSAIMAAITGFELFDDPTNPGWFTVFFFFGWLTFALGGYVRGYTPRSGTANGLAALVLLLGVPAVAFSVQAVTDFNFVVLVVAVVTATLFALPMTRYARLFRLHREGYQV